MKNILLLIHGDEGQEARYQSALDVARAVGGHLTCLDLTIIPEVMGDYVAMGVGGLLLAEEQESETLHGVRMRARLEREDVPFDWTETTGFLSQTIEARARMTDLIVLSTDEDGKLLPRMRDVIGDLLVHTGKPVLAVPPASRKLDVRGRAIVAWDGSPDAEAALTAAMPLLSLARCVTLYYADDKSMDTPIEDAARYLSRHGIEPVIKREPIGIDRVDVALRCEAEMGHYDLVVMGAYGHARTMETIFGGATQGMLKRCRVPLLLVHHR
ncbi:MULTISPECIES: universal stress protein [Sphingomonadaceae]|jgi:nucleotide-binding universal stress UspA family protein|uniref:UspA domain protein n=3 Tax=Sphingomonadaceae TaxID=41297 RepID=A0A081RIN4_SPHCR|nr:MULTISPECIES: universal stress protein [Sphingomonadaceae]HEX2020759.1 universal stress protein [Aurantimonas sp.]KEQ55057.1 UspA domain protein [Sphingobium chlorophenolicum]MBB3877097.1 nucleotide-binding universal stress UspA family protein [Sphingomonas aquatilis]MDK8187542.1 universal stress protein [Sphingomonas zeae]MDK8217298.1 universal stress protein [Sphingomonas sp. UMB7805-LC452B]